MTVRFLADENLDVDIIRGLLAREPGIDILDVKTAGLRGTDDPALLELAARQDRVLIHLRPEDNDAILSTTAECWEAYIRRLNPSTRRGGARRDH